MKAVYNIIWSRSVQFFLAIIFFTAIALMSGRIGMHIQLSYDRFKIEQLQYQLDQLTKPNEIHNEDKLTEI